MNTYYNDIVIELKHNSEREAKTKEQLLGLLKSYNIKKWIYTKEVIIDERSIPHSHPILTIHTRYINNDFDLLSTFIHEQIHWYLCTIDENVDKAIDEFKTLFVDVPVGFPEGAESEYSTYLHLIVNFLEYQALIEVIGSDSAKDVIEY